MVNLKRKPHCDGRKPNWNPLPTGITRDLSKLVCEVRRTDKCSFISIFALILKPLVHIPSMVSVKYSCRRNLSPKVFLDHQKRRKDSQTIRSSWSFDDVIADTKRYIHGSERPTLNSIRQTDVDTLMIRTQSRVRVRVRVRARVRIRVRIRVRVRVRVIYLNQTNIRHQILGGVGVRVMHSRSDAQSSNPTHSILNCFFP